MDKIKGAIWGLIACAIISMLLCGCRSTRCVPVESVRTEYKDRVVMRHDTVRDSVMRLRDVYRHDSVAVMMRGDTVFVDRWHTLRQSSSLRNRTEKSRMMHDTIYVNRTDSVRVPVAVERKLTRWERMNRSVMDVFAVIGMITAVAVVGLLLLWLIKRKRGGGL